jgi:hypothetical protein
LPKLTSAPNVTTIGYVRIDYCRKPLHEACEEIDRFAGWVTKHGRDVPGMEMSGIYVDETPNHFSAGRKLYLEALHKYIKGKDGLLGQRLVSLKPNLVPAFAAAPLSFLSHATGCFPCVSLTVQRRSSTTRGRHPTPI